MLTRDYIMRMIDTLVKALAKLIFQKDAKNYPEALNELEKITKEFFGFDRKLIERVSDAQLISMISASDTLLPPNCYLLGVLFKEEAEIFELQKNHEKSLTQYERSLNLFIEGLKNSPALIEPDHLNKINFVAEKLEDNIISIETEVNLFYYYELSGKFDKAENLIFDLIDYDSAFLEKGILFFERLLEKPDEIIMMGNLTRGEVEESILNLKEKLTDRI